MKYPLIRTLLVAGLALGALAQALAAQAPAPAGPPAPLEDLVGGVRQPEQTTSGVDAQHSRWVRLDQFIRPERMGLFKPRWTLRIDGNRPVGGLTYAAGPTATVGISENIGVMGGSDNNIAAYDTDTGKLFWQRRFTEAPAPANPSLACPGATAVSVTRSAVVAPPAVTAVTARAPAPRFGSAFGAPGEGLPQAFVDANRTNPNPVRIVDPNAPPAPAGGGRGGAAAPAAAGAGRAGAPATLPAPAAAPAAGAAPAAAAAAPAAGGGGRGFGANAPNANYIYAVTNDGRLHYLGIESGKDILEPAPFLPAGAQPTDLIAVTANGAATVYAATVHGCGGVANGLYAFNLTTKAVTSWKSGAASPSGPPSFALDGTAYLAAGDSVTALDPVTLTPKAAFSRAGADFTGSPVVFTSGEKTIIAALAADGRVFLLDAANLAGAPLALGPASPRSGFRPGGLASWEDETGQRWVLVPTATSVIAYKVAAAGTGLSPGFTVPGLIAPLPPIVMSGVVFIASSGRYVPAAGSTATASQLAARGRPGKVVAVDGKTGKPLWDSGIAIRSWIPEKGFWSTVGNIEVATYDNVVMQFGMNMERYAP